MSIGLKYQEIGGGVTKEDVEELCNYDMREKGVKIEKVQKTEGSLTSTLFEQDKMK